MLVYAYKLYVVIQYFVIRTLQYHHSWLFSTSSFSYLLPPTSINTHLHIYRCILEYISNILPHIEWENGIISNFTNAGIFPSSKLWFHLYETEPFIQFDGFDLKILADKNSVIGKIGFSLCEFKSCMKFSKCHIFEQFCSISGINFFICR